MVSVAAYLRQGNPINHNLTTRLELVRALGGFFFFFFLFDDTALVTKFV
jgi:hypothetical protein